MPHISFVIPSPHYGSSCVLLDLRIFHGSRPYKTCILSIVMKNGRKSFDRIKELSTLNDIPLEDALFIDMNRKGVIADTEHDRIRFYLRISDDPCFEESEKSGVKDFFFVVPTHSTISNYCIKNNVMLLEDKEIGTIPGIVNDTCDPIYPRRNGTVLNLNPHSKSTCHGCAFCHTFKQTGRDVSKLKTEDFIKKHIEEWLKKYGKNDLSYLHRVDVVTGCFGSEEEASNNLHLIRDITSKYNYNGEIFYFGSEITSQQTLDKLKGMEPFALCLSLECFEDRDRILKKHKSIISLEHAKEILGGSKEKGFGSQFSYVLGIEPLEVVLDGMEEFLPYVNRLPVVNVFQPHTQAQTKLLAPEAHELEYFLDARKGLEKMFGPTGYRPRIWGNYRCLWYLKFQDERLKGERLP